PRLQVFVDPGEVVAARAAVDAGLPEEFAGWPVRFGWDDVPVSHHVAVTDLESWVVGQLGIDPRAGLAAKDWLGLPQQLLLEVTAGAVFADPAGELARIRQAVAWYPDQVWRWLLACQWRRLAQEEPFVGRTAEVGDELGSRVLAARQVREVMRLCLLLERRYAPYAKWLGSAFAQLDAAREVGPPLARAFTAVTFPQRQAGLCEAYEAVARRHNSLGITEPVEATVRPFYTRPFHVLDAGRFCQACLSTVTDPWLRSLPLTGAIDQAVDSTDVLSNARVSKRLAAFWAQ
ncbi:MAG: DUF4037 domain-containing protein, partial [Pseudonocardiaceae bacterium]